MNTDQERTYSMELSKKPLEEKTVMFIENYYNGARGIISKLFKAYLESPLYKDYKFVWMARDYEEAVRIYGTLIDDKRVWLCYANGRDYVRFLNVSKYIITALHLPSFFIKREGQVIFYAPIDYYISSEIYTKAMLWRLNPTLNDSDRVLLEDGIHGIDSFSCRFGVGDKVKRLNLSYESLPSDREKAEKNKTVFVSMMDKQRSIKGYAVFQYVYDTITSLSEAYGYEVHWKVSIDYYRKYREDDLSIATFKNIHSGDEDCRIISEKADIIISDNFTDVLTADRYCGNIIFYYNKDFEFDDLKMVHDLMYTNDYERLLDLLEMKLSGGDSVYDKVDTEKVPVLFDCPSELYGEKDYGIIANPRTQECGVCCTDKRKKAILVLNISDSGLTIKKLHKILSSYKDDINITVFFVNSAGGALYDHLKEMGTDISYICRSGMMRCTDAEKKAVIGSIKWEERSDAPHYYDNLENVLRDEWKRCLGRSEFDLCIFMSGMSRFWDNMERVFPAERVLRFNKSKNDQKLIEIFEKGFRSICSEDAE